MDVIGWGLERKMELPDWCFGNRDIISAYKHNGAPGTRVWDISSHSLPDPCCIWSVVFVSLPSTGGTGVFRIGLANAVPTSEAEMNAAVEIFPGYGKPCAGPNEIILFSGAFCQWTISTRKGLVTGGKKLVLEVRCVVADMRVSCSLVYSELPEEIPAHLDPNTI